MGAETSQLDVNIADISPCDDTSGYGIPSYWKVHDYECNDESVSVLVHCMDSEKESFDDVMTPLKHIKSLRHPDLLKVTHVQYSANSALLVTEPVKPLTMLVDHMSALEISAGLYSVLQAVEFLHNQCFLSHGSIGPNSIFVSDDGEWRLGGFETCTRLVDVSYTSLKQFKTYRKQCQAPEEKKGGPAKDKVAARALDLFGVGKLVEYLLPYLEDMEETRRFEPVLEALLSSAPRDRPDVSKLMSQDIFKYNPFLEMVIFLQNVLLKAEEEKKQFFSSLLPRLRALPAELVATRLSRLLLSRFVVLCSHAREHVLPALLSARPESVAAGPGKPLLTEPQLRCHVLPRVFRMFSVREKHLRMTLLVNLPLYANLFDLDSLTALLPQILLGLRDTDEQLVAATLCGLAALVPLLGANTVVGSHRHRIFVSGAPQIPGQSTQTFDVSSFGNVADVIFDPHLKKPKDTAAAREQLSFSRLEREERRKAQQLRTEQRRVRRERERVERSKPKPVTLKELSDRAKAVRLASDTVSIGRASVVSQVSTVSSDSNETSPSFSHHEGNGGLIENLQTVPSQAADDALLPLAEEEDAHWLDSEPAKHSDTQEGENWENWGDPVGESGKGWEADDDFALEEMLEQDERKTDTKCERSADSKLKQTGEINEARDGKFSRTSTEKGTGTRLTPLPSPSHHWSRDELDELTESDRDTQTLRKGDTSQEPVQESHEQSTWESGLGTSWDVHATPKQTPQAGDTASKSKTALPGERKEGALKLTKKSEKDTSIPKTASKLSPTWDTKLTPSGDHSSAKGTAFNTKEKAVVATSPIKLTPKIEEPHDFFANMLSEGATGTPADPVDNARKQLFAVQAVQQEEDAGGDWEEFDWAD